MRLAHALASWAGLTAAVIGAGSAVRGDWGAAAGCLVALLVATGLEVRWAPTE